ncbi:peptide ABC transporter substrate-binding protein [Haloimpatiens sp. FM7330]|uniref:peptide ABC transporter substrate-binding protein n=1 Tax=Haloimpatiens sp. FM7330 TaxID=3298610 RepID=UPI00362B3E98
MKGKKLMALLVGVCLVSSLGLFGCGEAKQTSKNVKQSIKMDKEQYINVNFGAEPKTLDLSKATDVYSCQIFQEVMEGLTRLEQDGDGKDVVKAAGAEKWEHNEEGTVWTFHLRDYNWTDGKKVTAEDFVYSLRRTLDPKTGAPQANLLYVIKNGKAINEGKTELDTLGVKAVDENTLQVTLEQPCPYFFQLTYNKAFLPQRKDVVEKHGDKYGSDGDKLIFCGPFVIDHWTHNSEVVLSKNDKYWDKKAVNLEKINFKIIKDVNAMYNSLYTGALDSAGVSQKEWIKKFDATKKFDRIQGFLPAANYTFFNCKDKIFKNANIRKAFSIGITREDLCNVIFKGRYKAAYGWIPKKIQVDGKEFREMVDEPIRQLKEDNPDPKELLKKGMKELGMEPDPSKLEVTFLQSGTDQWYRTYAEYIQQMYKKTLGVNIKAEYVEWPVFQKRVDEGKYQIAGMSMSGDYNDPNTFMDGFISASAYVPTFWKNKEYDKLVVECQNIMDQEKRLEDYKKAEKILLYDDAAISPTAYRTRNTYKYKYVKNLMLPLFGSAEYKYVYIKGRK